MWLVLRTLLIAFIGGLLLYRLGLSIGWLVGSMAAVAACSLSGRVPVLVPRPLRVTGELLLGAAIGSLFTVVVFQFLFTYSLAVAISAGGAIAAGLVCGQLLLRWSNLDPVTAYFATTVGGSAEMASLSRAAGGDDRVVAAYHSIRIGIVVLLVPLVMSAVTSGGVGDARTLTQWDLSHLFGDLVICLLGGAGAWVAHRFRLPGGILLGALLAIGTANSLGLDLPQLPREFRYAGQLLIGAAIGSTFDVETLRRVRSILGIQMINTVILFVMSGVWALLLWSMTPLDPLTAILSTVPAGSSDMASTALALGADAPVVAAIQSIRVVLVSLIMPFLIRFTIRRREAKTA